MGDFAADTAVEGRDGRYRATASDSWEIWGPQGGYLAAIAIRAAGAESAFPRPASFYCHFVRGASFGPIDIAVESLRIAKRAQSLRVTLSQDGGSPVLEAFVWTAAELEGRDHDAVVPPQVPEPHEVEPWETYLPGGEPPFPFWRNFDVHTIAPRPEDWVRATEPRSVSWNRLRERPPLEDPFVDAGRMLVAADSAMFPAATLAHDDLFPYIAPSLDLSMSFHAAGAASEWLLIDACSPLSRSALVYGTASVWSLNRELLGSATQQMLQRTS